MPDFPAGLVQPDQRSCGAACLVVARALEDPAYAARVTDTADFRTEVFAMHRRVTSPADVSGSAQVPWPRAFGTPPWAVERQLEGTRGVSHRVRPSRWGDAGQAYDELVDTAAPAAVYVGNAWLPRHVVLVMEASRSRLRCYEPARGQVLSVDRDRFVGHDLGLAGWDVPWCTVLPDR